MMLIATLLMLLLPAVTADYDYYFNGDNINFHVENAGSVVPFQQEGAIRTNIPSLP